MGLVRTDNVGQVVGSEKVVNGLSAKAHSATTTGRVAEAILVQTV